MLTHEPLVYVLAVVVIVLSLMLASEIVEKSQMRKETLRQEGAINPNGAEPTSPFGSKTGCWTSANSGFI